MYKSIPDQEGNDTNNLFVKSSKYLQVLVKVMIAAIAAASTTWFSRGNEFLPSFLLGSTSDISDVSRRLIVSNEYERATQRRIGDGMYPYDYLVQVNKETSLELDDKTSVSWRIRLDAMNETLVEIDDGELVSMVFPTVGTYTVFASDGESLSTFTVTAKVVRWELRSLTDTDRGAYFEALRTFYVTSQSEGTVKYGNDYLSLTYLLRQHIYGAASKDCDHWHDGAGIVNHHIGITWAMEKSLRLIDDSTAAHYWDYTIEYDEGVQWHDSIIFENDWFGDNSPSNPSHIVTGGRFGYLPVMVDARGFSDITNPYGMLRSPWNTNPTPYLMRYNATVGSFADENDYFPNCSEFASYIKSGEVSFADLSSAINGQLHGPVHIMIGGHWGLHAHADVWDRIAAVSQSLFEADSFLLYSKFLWRQGFIRLPEYCATDLPASSCTAHCPSEITENFNASYILSKAGFEHVNPQYWKTTAAGALSGMGVEYTSKKLLELLCSIGHPGEMYTSSAPQDPTFWPLHGNAERFVQLVRVLDMKGVVTFNETWGYTHQRAASDTHTVCDWSVVQGGYDMPTCIQDECSGHKETDLLPFMNLTTDQERLYSNKEFWGVISPFNDELPYVYDGLSTWTGCRDNSMISEAGLYMPS